MDALVVFASIFGGALLGMILGVALAIKKKDLDSDSDSDSDLDFDGAVINNYFFMPPEYLEEKFTSEKSDE